MRAVKEKLEASYAATAPDAGPVDKLRSYPARTRRFLHDVRLELRNVTWPSWKDVKATTVVVLVTTFFFGFYLGVVLDYPLARLMQQLLLWGRSLVR